MKYQNRFYVSNVELREGKLFVSGRNSDSIINKECKFKYLLMPVYELLDGVKRCVGENHILNICVDIVKIEYYNKEIDEISKGMSAELILSGDKEELKSIKKNSILAN